LKVYMILFRGRLLIQTPLLWSLLERGNINYDRFIPKDNRLNRSRSLTPRSYHSRFLAANVNTAEVIKISVT
jgi:hypothetical protein